MHTTPRFHDTNLPNVPAKNLVRVGIGGFLPREILYLLGAVAKEGICGMEVVEVSPPYDQSEITALLAPRHRRCAGHPGGPRQAGIAQADHSRLGRLR